MSSIIAPAANAGAIELLENVLAKVKAGQISSLAILTVTPLGGFNCASAGLQGAELFCAAHQFSDKLMAAMTKNSAVRI